MRIRRQSIAKGLAAAGKKLMALSTRVYESPKNKRNAAWRREHGDGLVRVRYDLGAESLVLDLGGYKGQWASDIFAMYCCRIHIFEVVPKFAEQIRERFARNDKITVHSFGLGSRDEQMELRVAADGSSVFQTKRFKQDEGNIRIQLVQAAGFFAQSGLKKVDLMKINIEGGEYELLAHLIDSKLIERIENLQIQFHDFVPDAEQRMSELQAKLKKTHEATYLFPFVWENWRRR